MPASKEVVFENNESKLELDAAKRINIIHFNDVYNVEDRTQEPVAGAARFVNLLEQLKQSNNNENEPVLVLFSGDAVSPSSISMLVEGKQMIDVLNRCHIDCACLGNHEFDFGLDVISKHVLNSNFPWLLSNLIDVDTEKPLANARDRHIIEINGIKIGLIGLVEEEWIATLSTIEYDDLIYEPFIDAGRRLAKELKTDQNCDVVIALTHMRWDNDVLLAENVPEIDLFLGGHDHDYGVKEVRPNKWLIKSGHDFRELNFIETIVDQQTKPVKLIVNRIEKYEVNSQYSPKPEILALIDEYLKKLSANLDVTLGHMNVQLNGLFSDIRTRETNLGNFITDIMLESVNADCALLNSGTIRSDTLHDVGEFKVKDLKKILPFLDRSIALSVTGSKLVEALENGVATYPRQEGRFLQVSGLRFAFDPSKPAGKRIDPKLVLVQDEPLQLEREYVVMVKEYMHKGKDGFECLMDCPVLIDEENIPVTFNLVVNHFKTIQKLKANRDQQKYRSSIVPLFKVHKLMYSISQSIDESENENESGGGGLGFPGAAYLITRLLSHKRKVLSKKRRIMIRQTPLYKEKMRQYEDNAMKLAPQCEDRIICIRDQSHYEQLLEQFTHSVFNTLFKEINI